MAKTDNISVKIKFTEETLGGFHAGAVVQVNQIAAALARSKGSEESEAISQLFGKLSLTLQRCNAMMLSSRHQDSDFASPALVALCDELIYQLSNQ